MEEPRDPGQVEQGAGACRTFAGEEHPTGEWGCPHLCPKRICPDWTLTGLGDSTTVGCQLLLGGTPQPMVGWHPLLRGTNTCCRASTPCQRHPQSLECGWHAAHGGVGKEPHCGGDPQCLLWGNPENGDGVNTLLRGILGSSDGINIPVLGGQTLGAEMGGISGGRGGGICGTWDEIS